MRWTSKQPQKNGWYWYRRKDREEPRPVYMEVLEKRGAVFRDGRLPISADEWGGEWAGPIELPSDA